MSNSSIASEAASRIAVVIPCYQEGTTIRKVVGDFKREVPAATVYVFDNNSTDETDQEARSAGAVVRREKRQGKGYVVASLLAEVDADIIVMVDGDDTYDARSVHQLIAPIQMGRADMVVGTRLQSSTGRAFRRFHVAGNQLVTWLVNAIFRTRLTDMFSGYRSFSGALAKSVPVVARGFDVETELTVQALYRGLVIAEVPAPYGDRPVGSYSKLRTIRDGARVLLKLGLLVQAYKPLTFFGGLGIMAFLMAMAVGARPILEFAAERYVYSVPSAVLAAALVVLGTILISVGIILHGVNFRLMELEQLVLNRTSR